MQTRTDPAKRPLAPREQRGAALASIIRALRDDDNGAGQWRVVPCGDWTEVRHIWPDGQGDLVARLDLSKGIARAGWDGWTGYPDEARRIARSIGGRLECPVCHGDGELIERPVSAPRGCEPDVSLVPCDECGGTGYLDDKEAT